MTLSVYFNDVVDWIIAESPEEAYAICKTWYGCGDDDMEDCGDFLKMDNDESLTIVDDGKETTERHTVKEWIDIYGKGFLCSTEY